MIVSSLRVAEPAGSEAEGEDLTTISSYTTPITRLVGARVVWVRHRFSEASPEELIGNALLGTC